MDEPEGVDLPKGILEVPEVVACQGCVYKVNACNLPKRGCSQSKTIFIRDTPEAKAAYVALRLEKSNG